MRTVVSVIISERRPGEARTATASALEQEGVDAEVLVLEQGGPGRVTDDDPRVSRIRAVEGPGSSAAYNLGGRLATGEWLAFLSATDRWAPDHLIRMITGCQESGSDFGCCAAWLIDREERIQGFRSVPETSQMERTFLRGDSLPCPSALVVRGAFWERIGGFDEWLDGLAALDLCIRWSRCARGWTDPAPTVALRDVLPASLTGLKRLRDEFHELDRRYGQDARRLDERFGSGELAALLAQEHIRARSYRPAARWIARHASSRSPRLYLRLLGLVIAGARSRAALEVMRPVPARRLQWHDAERGAPSKH